MQWVFFIFYFLFNINACTWNFLFCGKEIHLFLPRCFSSFFFRKTKWPFYSVHNFPLPLRIFPCLLSERSPLNPFFFYKFPFPKNIILNSGQTYPMPTTVQPDPRIFSFVIPLIPLFPAGDPSHPKPFFSPRISTFTFLACAWVCRLSGHPPIITRCSNSPKNAQPCVRHYLVNPWI